MEKRKWSLSNPTDRKPRQEAGKRKKEKKKEVRGQDLSQATQQECRDERFPQLQYAVLQTRDKMDFLEKDWGYRGVGMGPRTE